MSRVPEPGGSAQCPPRRSAGASVGVGGARHLPYAPARPCRSGPRRRTPVVRRRLLLLALILPSLFLLVAIFFSPIRALWPPSPAAPTIDITPRMPGMQNTYATCGTPQDERVQPEKRPQTLGRRREARMRRESQAACARHTGLVVFLHTQQYTPIEHLLFQKLVDGSSTKFAVTVTSVLHNY